MALFSRLRTSSLSLRHFSAAAILSRDRKTPLSSKEKSRAALSLIKSRDRKTPLSSKEKSRAALSLIKSEQNPEKILEICRAASLTPDLHLDRIVFSEAISKLSKSNNFSYITEFLDELRRSRPDLKTERFAAHAIVLFGQAKMLDQARRVFREFHEERGEGFRSEGKAFNALLFACVLAKDFGELKRIFVEFPKVYNIAVDEAAYNTVVKGFCESGNSSLVYSILAEMDRRRVRPDAATFAHLLAGFYKEEKYEDVGKVLTLMSEYRIAPGVPTYNVRIKSLCKLKRSHEAKGLLDGMLSRGMKPNSETYGQLIRGFCNQGELEEAMALFKNMVNRGCQPDSECYFTLVHYLCIHGQFETALRICFESMEKKWVPNFSTMKTLVRGLAKIGRVAEAKKLAGLMKEKYKKNVHLWEEIEIEAGLTQ